MADKTPEYREYRVVVLSVATGRPVIDQQIATNARDAASWSVVWRRQIPIARQMDQRGAK